MIFDITTIGNSSGGLPEYVWLEYLKASDVLEIQYRYLTEGTKIVNLPRSSSDTSFGPVYKTLSISDYRYGTIQGFNATYPTINSGSDYLNIDGFYYMDSTTWIGNLSHRTWTDFNTGNMYTGLRYQKVAVAVQIAGIADPIKAIHLTEHSGQFYRKVPIISLMGGGK